MIKKETEREGEGRMGKRSDYTCMCSIIIYIYLSLSLSQYTALMFATITGSVPVVQLLLESGANVDKTNNVNRTAAQMGGFVGNNNNKLESNQQTKELFQV